MPLVKKYEYINLTPIAATPSAKASGWIVVRRDWSGRLELSQC